MSVRAYGATCPELFENAAEAMFAIGRDLSAIPPRYSRPLVAPGDTVEELLANWLEELLHVGKLEGFAWSFSIVDRLETGGVQGSASGLPLNEVETSHRTVTGIHRPTSDVVSIPDGYWVEIDFVTGTPVRVL